MHGKFQINLRENIIFLFIERSINRKMTIFLSIFRFKSLISTDYGATHLKTPKKVKKSKGQNAFLFIEISINRIESISHKLLGQKFLQKFPWVLTNS